MFPWRCDAPDTSLVYRRHFQRTVVPTYVQYGTADLEPAAVKVDSHSPDRAQAWAVDKPDKVLTWRSYVAIGLLG